MIIYIRCQKADNRSQSRRNSAFAAKKQAQIGNFTDLRSKNRLKQEKQARLGIKAVKTVDDAHNFGKEAAYDEKQDRKGGNEEGNRLSVAPAA